MNVLFVIHGGVFGGPHNQALRLRGPLAARGIETVVLLPRGEGNAAARLRDGGVEVVEIELRRLRATPDPRIQARFVASLAPDIRRIRRVIRERAIDVVQVGGLVNPHAAIAARLEHKPVVWQLLDTRAPTPLALISMLFVRALATVVMPTGLKVLDQFPGAGSVRSKVVPFFPPVDTEAFRPQPDLRSSVRREWGVALDVPVVGAVANINPQKGHLDLVRAFARARAEHPGLHLVLIGSEHESHRGYAERVHALVDAVGLLEERDVTFVGPRADVARQLQGFDVMALASVPRSEGIPTVLLEAMACGVPVVATDVGGVSEVVEHGVTGLVVPASNDAALGDAIRALVADPSLRQQMSAKGRARAAARFSLARSAEVHSLAYARALSASGRANRRANGRGTLQ